MPMPRDYAEAASWISVRTEQSDYERVLEILDRDGAVDLDKQEARWRGEAIEVATRKTVWFYTIQ